MQIIEGIKGAKGEVNVEKIRAIIKEAKRNKGKEKK